MLAKQPNPAFSFVGFVLVTLLIFSTTTNYHEKLIPLSFHGRPAAVGQLPVSATGDLAPSQQSHNEVFSVSRKDGQYWPIDFGGVGTINPSIIPHPDKTDVWIVVAARMNPIDSAYGQ